MPPKKPTQAAEDATPAPPPIKKTLLFNISSIPQETPLTIPISSFLQKNDAYYVKEMKKAPAAKGGKKGAPQEPEEPENVPDTLDDLHLYAIIDFHSTTAAELTASLPLYQIPLCHLPSLNLIQYREASEEPQLLHVPITKSEGFSSQHMRQTLKVPSNIMNLSLPTEQHLLDLLDASVTAYLVLSRKLPEQGEMTLTEDPSGKKKPTKPPAKGATVDSSAASRKKLEEFLTQHNAQYIQEFSLGESFLKRFIFETRYSEEAIAEDKLSAMESSGKKAPAKKGAAPVVEEKPEVITPPLRANFAVALMDSPGGLLSNVESSSYYLRVKLDKLVDLPVKEYEACATQIKPLHVEYEYNGELHLSESFPQQKLAGKKLKLNHEVLIQFEKEDVEEWRSRFENDPLDFIVRDRDLKYLPLPKPLEGGEVQQGENADVQEKTAETTDAPPADATPQYAPTEVAQYFAIASLYLDGLASGKITRLNEDLPLQTASETIPIPIPKPKVEEPPPEEPKKGAKGAAAKKKGKDPEPPAEEEQPPVEYTEEPILVKQGHFLDNGTYLRVSVQLSKPLPEPNTAARAGAVVIKAHPVHDAELLHGVFEFLTMYEPETVSRPASASPTTGGATKASKGKKTPAPAADEEPKMEIIVNTEDYFTGVSITTPEEQIIIVEGLAESGVRKFTAFLQMLGKQAANTTFSVLANWAITFAARRYYSADAAPAEVEAPLDDTPPKLSTNRLSALYLSESLTDIVNSKETHSDSCLLRAASDLLELSHATNIRNITNARLWPTWEHLQMIQSHFGITEEEGKQNLENQILAAQQELDAAEEEIPENIEEDAPLTLQDLYECLGQDIVIDAIPVPEPPPGYPDARKVVIEGEEERWQARREMPRVQDDLSIVEDKLWVYVPTLNAHLLVSLLPREVQPEPSFAADANDNITFQESPLPPHHLMSSFAGELIGTDLENVLCILTRAWNQHASKAVDDRLPKHLIPKPKKYTKGHFVTRNKKELREKSELIKRKRKLQERIEDSKLHPLVREARQKVLEAAQNAPVFMYAGQRDRWSEIQQATMREAMRQSRRKDNYTFSSGNFLSLSFSAISNKEIEETKTFRKLQPVRNKADFKYPAPRPPGTWTQPDKQLHPSKITELRTTTHTSANDINKLLEHNSGPLPPGKSHFQVSMKLGGEFSTVPKLGFEDDSKMGAEAEAEQVRQREKEKFLSKVVVDDLNFHVSHKSRNPVHPLDKGQTMLKSPPKRIHLKKKPLKAEPYSITSSDKYRDVTKRPFQEVLGVAATRTQLPVTLGVRENVSSFYLNNKEKDVFTKMPNYSRSIKPLSPEEKVGHKWGAKRSAAQGNGTK